MKAARMILKSKSDHVPIQDSREGVSEEVTFELQDEASHVRIQRRYIPGKGMAHAKVLGQQRAQHVCSWCDWSTVTKGVRVVGDEGWVLKIMGSHWRDSKQESHVKLFPCKIAQWERNEQDWEVTGAIQEGGDGGLNQCEEENPK